MNQQLGRLIISAVTIAFLGGCTKDPGTPTILQASPTPFVNDLPLPAKFKLVEQQSEDRSVPGRRYVKHVYEGPSDAMAVNNFYLQYMPQGNWELQEQRLDKGGVYHLKYRKGLELCEITIERMPTPSGTFTHIRANIQSMMETPG